MAQDKIATFSDVGMGGLGRTINCFGSSDPMAVTRFYEGVYRNPDIFRQGLVVTYNPQTHSASVLMDGTVEKWSCVFADEHLSYSFGFSATNPPKEGEMVLVLRIAPDAQAGIIIGRLPYALLWEGTDLYNDPDQYHRRFFIQKKDTADREIPCFKAPFENPNDDSTHIATHFRPTDVYPGEFAFLNQHNCGLKGGLFSSTLIGGGAQLRMSGLSNMARLICESYLRHSMHGTLHEFHNSRFLSSERNLALYQEERLGGDSKEAKVWTDDSEAPVEGENQTMRPRMKDLTGFFGHLSSKFCLRPDPTSPGIRVQGKGAPKEEGVSRETIDPSGQYRMSASGMLVLERTGRIPVPVRKCYPTDKDHDPEEPERLQPFEHKDWDPCYRQLELFDRQAYDLKNQYARVDGLGFEDKADYEVPQESELNPLQDQYDPNFDGNETVKLTKYDTRRAGVYIGEDGSVIIRDAWGSEIAMAGGNITLASAGNVYLLPVKTVLGIAGDDIVLKAQNSVDIHASEHDVRLSAARNMEIIGGGDEDKYSGGVVIEAKGKNPNPWNGKEQGESARLQGITLRTSNQGIVLDGKKVNIRSKDDTRIISGDKDVDGKVSIAAKKVRLRGKEIISASNNCSFRLNNGNMLAVSKNIGMFADKSFNITKGTKTPIPMKWEDIGNNFAASLIPTLDKITEDLTKEKEASFGFDREWLEKMVFWFRTSEECYTTSPWTIRGPGPFKLYEPAWRQVLNKYETLQGIGTKTYKEGPQWENGKPFPGKEVEPSAMYAQLVGLEPKNLTSEGFNRSRKLVEKQSEITEVPLVGAYIIRS